MSYDIKAKFIKNSPLPCWKGYKRKRGTKKFSKGSCVKASAIKDYVSDEQRKAVWASKADGGAGNPNKMLSPIKAKTKGGGTKKVCLPKAKIASMSLAERAKVIRAKRAAGKAGKYKRSSKSNVTGTKSDGLRDWVKQDWRQVGNPSKKCGEK